MSTFVPRPSNRERKATGTGQWSGLERFKHAGLQVLAVVVSVGLGYTLLLAPAVASELAPGSNRGPAIVTVTSQQAAALDPADIDALTQALPGAIISRGLVPVSLFATGNSAPLNIQSVDSTFFSVYGLQTSSGTLFTPADDLRANPVAVIGQQVAQTAFGNAAAATGKSLRVRNVSLTVIGVLATPSNPDLASFSQSVFVPLQTGKVRLVGAQVPAQLVIGASSAANAANIAALASHVLAARYPAATSAFSVQVHDEDQAPASIPQLLTRATTSVRAEFLAAKGLALDASRTDPGILQ